MNFGAALINPTTTRYRFWAPAPQSVALEVEGLEPVPMRRLDDGWFEAETLCGAGAVFRFRIARRSGPVRCADASLATVSRDRSGARELSTHVR
jgi:1,4-alpha-glucan branching enzyme